jgi:hypothetical protein
MKIPTLVPEPGFYYHYKHDPNGTVNNYAYEVWAPDATPKTIVVP